MSSPSKPSRHSSPIFTTHIDMMALQPDKKKNMTPPHTTSTRGRESVYSKRTTKSNPLIHKSGGSSNEGRETRRKLFLKRVRDVADEKRWKERGIGEDLGEEEEVLRCIWMQEERKREERRQREAQILGLEPTPEDVEEVEIDMDEEELMAEEIARVDEMEMEQYYEMVGGAYQNTPMDGEIESRLPHMDNHHAPTASKTESLYGSDDDEYDEIFMDVIVEEQRASSQQVQSAPGYVDDQEMMDMS